MNELFDPRNIDIDLDEIEEFTEDTFLELTDNKGDDADE